MRADFAALWFVLASPATTATPPDGEPRPPPVRRGGQLERQRTEPSSRLQLSNPVLQVALVPPTSSYWVIGVASEVFGHQPDEARALFGASAIYRGESIGPYALLLANSRGLLSTHPSFEGYEDWHYLAGLGVRGFLSTLGTEWSYGIGAHGEIRLQDHYWLGYLTPLELGVVLDGQGSRQIKLFFGARRAALGSLINHFIIDPNGLDNENAQDNLDRLLHHDPWQGFVRVVFGRRID